MTGGFVRTAIANLVHAAFGNVAQTLDLVLHLKFAPLQLGDFQIVGARTRELALDLALQCLVLAFKIGQLRMPVHGCDLFLCRVRQNKSDMGAAASRLIRPIAAQ